MNALFNRELDGMLAAVSGDLNGLTHTCLFEIYIPKQNILCVRFFRNLFYNSKKNSSSTIPDDYDLYIYPKHNSNCETKKVYMNKLSHHVDPMVFPILFPFGDLGWSIGYKKKPNVDSKRKG